MSTLDAPARPHGHATVHRPTAPDRASRRRIRIGADLDLVYSAVFAWFGFVLGFSRLSDNSFFTHLVTGRWILDHGLQHGDVYSFTAPGAKVVGQSWLAEAGYAVLERTGGLFGIRAFGAVLGAVLTVSVFRLALRCAGDRTRAALVAAPALGGVWVLWASRPFMIGLLALLVVVWVVEVPASRVGRHPLVALPVVFLVWANVHGSFALGFAYLGLHLVGRWTEGAVPWRGRERVLSVGAGLGLAACLVNPYGFEQLWFPVHLLGRARLLRHVVEWSSPDFHRLRGQVLLVWLVVFLVVLARAPRRAGRRDLIVTIPFLLLGFWALRNVGLAPLVGLPVVARLVSRPPASEPVDAGGHAPSERSSGPTRSGSPFVGVLLVGLVLVGAVGVALRAAAEPDLLTRTYPVAALADLDARGLIGRRLLTTDVGAAWAELRYGSRQPVFMDDRYDTFPAAVIEDYYALSDGAPDSSKILDRWGVETVVWKRRSGLAALLGSDPAWTVVHRDPAWVTFVRSSD